VIRSRIRFPRHAGLAAAVLCFGGCEGSTGAALDGSRPSVRIDTDRLDLSIGERVQLHASVRSADGLAVTWRSTEPEVATVDANGSVLAVSAGGARIVAEVSPAADTVEVLVTAPGTGGGSRFARDQRPYTPDSPWNTPIPADAALDPRSDAMVATIAASSNGRLRSDPDQYAYPVYFAGSATPRTDLACTGVVSVLQADGTRSVVTGGVLADVPIPAGATPSAGTDAQIIVVDEETGDEYDIWRYAPPSQCENVTHYVAGVHRSGVEPRYASRGAGVPYLAGLVRPWEIEKGRIAHALAFGYPLNRALRCVWPASKTDGESELADAIPEGARLRLDPAVDPEQIPGLDAAGRIIARALQEYGAFVIDNSGSNKLYVEDNLTAAWGDRIVATTVSAIPVERLQVLRLPDAYHAEPYQPTHGDCVR
jgi:hypothetical protein